MEKAGSVREADEARKKLDDRIKIYAIHKAIRELQMLLEKMRMDTMRSTRSDEIKARWLKAAMEEGDRYMASRPIPTMKCFLCDKPTNETQSKFGIGHMFCLYIAIDDEKKRKSEQKPPENAPNRNRI
jgi:hypothetical protein